jgi:hypothetical protein
MFLGEHRFLSIYRAAVVNVNNENQDFAVGNTCQYSIIPNLILPEGIISSQRFSNRPGIFQIQPGQVALDPQSDTLVEFLDLPVYCWGESKLIGH